MKAILLLLYCTMLCTCRIEQIVATVAADPDAVHFLNEAFKYCKAVAAGAETLQVLEETYCARKLPEDSSGDTVTREGVIIGSDTTKLAEQFISVIALHRFWKEKCQEKYWLKCFYSNIKRGFSEWKTLFYFKVEIV